MSAVRFISLKWFLGFMVLCAAAAAWGGTGQTDARLLQGSWKGYEVQGSKMPWSLVIEGERIEVTGPGPSEWVKGTFTLDEKRDPKVMRILIRETVFLPFKGMTYPAAYKVENNRLVLAGYRPGSGKIPSSLEMKKGMRKVVFTRE